MQKYNERIAALQAFNSQQGQQLQAAQQQLQKLQTQYDKLKTASDEEIELHRQAQLPQLKVRWALQWFYTGMEKRMNLLTE